MGLISSERNGSADHEDTLISYSAEPEAVPVGIACGADGQANIDGAVRAGPVLPCELHAAAQLRVRQLLRGAGAAAALRRRFLLSGGLGGGAAVRGGPLLSAPCQHQFALSRGLVVPRAQRT